MSSGIQAVVAAAASFFFISLIVAIIYAIFKCKKARSRTTQISESRSHHGIRAARTGPNRDLSSIFIDQSASYDSSLEISMAELVRSTANFADDRVIGDGGFGLVYKACISSGATVAVKKLSKDAFQGFREFRAEMDTLGKLRHENIVKILGFCARGADRVLVYEFMVNGSLDLWLYDSPARPPLSWDRRTRIVRGVANGLKYLHGLETPIIHRDIKASNVLLDARFEAHIADFGLARMINSSHSHVSTQVAGTMGYMPPEYREGITAATPKADVYSFGVLMLETATGMRPSWPVREGGVEMGMVQWARRMVGENREMEMVDLNLLRGDGDGGGDGLLRDVEVGEFFRIACLCTSEMIKERPTMGEVVDLLNRTWK